MKGNYEGKTVEEVIEDLARVIHAAKEVRESSFDFNDKYDALLRYGIADEDDTLKEYRDKRRTERIKLNMYDVRPLAKALGKEVYYTSNDSEVLPVRGYFYFEDAEISSYYALKK